MTDAQSPISPDSPVCQTLNCLPEKFVVDFANGIDVARDHQRVQRSRSGFVARMYDGFTGKSARRQAEVHASLTDGVEASLTWLKSLSESLARSNLAIVQVNDRLTALTADVATLAHYSAQTRQQLDDMSQRLGARMENMSRDIARIDFIQRAQLNMDESFSKWASGRLAALSPAARCYAVLEELRWGAVGDYCRRHVGQRQSRDFMRMVADRATMQLAADAGIGLHTPVDTVGVWLAQPPARRGNGDDDMWQAIDYLADGMAADIAPFVNSATQRRPASQIVPLIATPRRLADGMVQELFPREVIDV